MEKGFTFKLLSRWVDKNGEWVRQGLTTTHDTVWGVHISAMKEDRIFWRKDRSRNDVDPTLHKISLAWSCGTLLGFIADSTGIVLRWAFSLDGGELTDLSRITCSDGDCAVLPAASKSFNTEYYKKCCIHLSKATCTIIEEPMIEPQ